ncbi:uncharacterized protein [Acropora muricata]|uniref:uncharacterized protein n=1 Tax=Acropora muricata TaxID=159855 RepID=UPI0034E5FCF2
MTFLICGVVVAVDVIDAKANGVMAEYKELTWKSFLTASCAFAIATFEFAFPFFLYLKGEDLREGNSPSWFNPVEAVQIVKYLQALKSSDKLSIKLNDVSIITPYRKRVEKTRLLLASVGLDEVKVGSVEEFQGQERLVIIISTVRSNASLVGSDVRHTIGFLSNPKRFNVAITRAQALVIVIGNPHVLCQDPYWCCLVQYCVVDDSYIGCDLPSLDQHFLKEEFQAATNLLSKLLLKDEINRNGDFTEGESNSVLQDLNESSNCAQAISNESNMQSCNGEDIFLVSEPREQIESSSSNNTQTSNKGGTLNMRDKPFAGPSVSSGAGPILTKESQQLCVSSEVPSDSDDELEQFVLQPKGRR